MFRFRPSTTATYTVGALAVLMAGLAPVATARARVEQGCDVQCQEERAALAATERYWDVGVAVRDGYEELPGCVTSTGGAVGVEYVHAVRSADQHVDVAQPESLWYLPEAFGGPGREGAGRRLAAVEYRVPFVDAAQEPPELFGRHFDGPVPGRLPGVEEYHLRVWLFSPNPDGLFADANPADACNGAGLVAPHAEETRLLEVAGTFAVDARLVREVLDVPSELRLRGERADGSGDAEITVSTRSFQWSSSGEPPQPTLAAGPWVNLMPPDWAGGDRDVDGPVTGYPFALVTDNAWMVRWMRQGMGIGSDVMAESDELVLDLDPTADPTAIDYVFTTPMFVLEAAIGDVAPVDTTTSWRFWHRGRRGMGLWRGWHDDMRLGAADIEVTPRQGTPLAVLLGCPSGASSCEAVPAKVGAVVTADAPTPWTVNVARDWWNPRLSLGESRVRRQVGTGAAQG